MTRRTALPAVRPLMPAALTALVALVVAACAGGPDPAASGGPSGVPSATPTATASPTPAPARIGVSTTDGATPWGEALLCSVRAEAATAGDIALTVRDRVTDGVGQAEDLTNLAAIGAEAIVVDPVDPAALTEAVTAIREEGIVVVSIGDPIPGTDALTMRIDREAAGELAGAWLSAAIGDKGGIVAVTGPADDPIARAYRTGFDRALAAHPDVKVTATIEAGDDEAGAAVAVERLNALLEERTKFAGIWTTGPDSVLVDALRIAERPLVPIAGGDGGAFVSQLLTYEGLAGAAVTDPPAIGGAALRLAVRALADAAPATPDVVLDPGLWDNATDAGRASLTAANDPAIELGWPLSLAVPGWTTASVADVVACGETTTGG